MSIEYPGQRWVLKLLDFKFNFKTILVYQIGSGIPLRRIERKDFFLLCHSLNIARNCEQEAIKYSQNCMQRNCFSI